MAKRPVSPWQNSTRKKRDNKYSEKRDAVLRAAAALFRDLGYERASLNDLADILKITKPTVYYYVHSKEQLLLDILRGAQEEILKSLETAVASDANGYDKLRAVMIDYAMIMISDHGACMARVPSRAFEQPAAKAEVDARIREADDMIYQILEEGRQDGTLQFTDRAVALHTLFGSLNWTAYWAKATGPLSPRQLAEAQVDLLLIGIRPVADRAPIAMTKPRAARAPRVRAAT